MNFKLFIETFPIFALNSRRNKNWMKEQSKHARWLVRLKQKSFISVQHFCHSLLRLVKGTSQSHQTKLLHRYTYCTDDFWDEEKAKTCHGLAKRFCTRHFYTRVLSASHKPQHCRTPHLLLPLTLLILPSSLTSC